MPLFPVPTYTSWQLACIAAIEPLDGPHPESIAEKARIRGELLLRGKSESDADEMVALAKWIGQEIRPIVCMGVDDLAFGIDALFDKGLIDDAAKERLVEFVRTHIDAPRETMKPPPAADDEWPGTSLAYALGRSLRAIFRRGK
jgi:hypothetical protein